MTAIAGSNYLLTMPLINDHDSISCYDSFGTPFVKSEIYAQQKQHHHQHQQQHQLSLSANQSPETATLASFEQPSFCAAFQSDALESNEDVGSDTRTSTPQLKTEDLPCLDPDTSAGSSPLNFPNELDFLPQLSYYPYNEEDSGSETSYGTQHSPVLPSSDYNNLTFGDNMQQWAANYYEMINTPQPTTTFQQGNGVQSSPEQMRFIIYEPEGTSLVPTLSDSNATVPGMWPSAPLTDPNAPRGGVMATTSPIPYFTTQPAAQASSIDATAAAVAAAAAASSSVKTAHAAGQQAQSQTIRCPHDDCPKTFSRLYNLKAHLRSHSTARPYQCPMCPRSFSRKHDLQRHIRVHTGVKPYVCPCCSKAFARTDALRRHFKMEETCRNSPEVQNMKTRRRYSEMH